MEACRKNRELVNTIGDLVEALFNEMENLPLSDGAKHAIVMVMLGDLLKRQGDIVYFYCPPELRQEDLVA